MRVSKEEESEVEEAVTTPMWRCAALWMAMLWRGSGIYMRCEQRLRPWPLNHTVRRLNQSAPSLLVSFRFLSMSRCLNVFVYLNLTRIQFISSFFVTVFYISTLPPSCCITPFLFCLLLSPLIRASCLLISLFIHHPVLALTYRFVHSII